LQNGHSTNGDHIDDDDAPHLNVSIWAPGPQLAEYPV
jgi:hypothetical protein